MPDLTSIYLEIVKQKQESLEPVTRQNILLEQAAKANSKQDQHQTDVFTKECLSVNGTINQLKHSIKTIRPAYLSSSNRAARGAGGGYKGGIGGGNGLVSLTEKERDDFDYEARMVIQQTVVRIRHLEELEHKRLEREKANRESSLTRKLLSFGGSVGLSAIELEKDQISKTLALHRAGILWYLNESLKEVSSKHASQQEIRLGRQLEKTKNSLHTVSDNYGHSSGSLYGSDSSSPSTGLTNPSSSFSNNSTSPLVFSHTPDDLPEALRELTPQQITVLESENSALMDELELSLNKARAAEKSLMEISQLQSSLAAHLSTQNDHIQNLLNESSQVHEDILQANKQLDSAKDRNRRASKLIITASLILAFLLLFYDYILS